MTTQYLVRMNDNFVEQLKNFAKEMGEELSIMAFDEKKSKIQYQELESKNKKPQTLEQALLALSELDLDLEDDFFKIPQEPMREIDWSE